MPTDNDTPAPPSATLGVCPLCSRPIFSVRAAIAETDLPTDMGSAEAIRTLWDRLTCLGPEVATAETVTVVEAPAHTPLMCAHGRPDGYMCPHCGPVS